MGQRLIEGIARMARLPVVVTGFGAAFAIHFTNRTELRDYRDTLANDTSLLRRFLQRALEQGLHIVPDGRMYVSAAHTERDIDDTLARLEVVFSELS
jgi:glutamate-1-semialdehyde aminotransferase